MGSLEKLFQGRRVSLIFYSPLNFQLRVRRVIFSETPESFRMEGGQCSLSEHNLRHYGLRITQEDQV
jgi:hypothetical protein